MGLPIRTTTGQAYNKGRTINFLTGFQGISAGPAASNPTINIPTNQRIHNITLRTSAVNYTGGVALPTVHLTGAGNNALTVTLVPVTGVPNNPAIVAGGAGYAVGDTFSVTDPTGKGGVFTVTAVAGGAVTAATYNANSAVASPIDPGALLNRVKMLVNGVNIRDISARFTLMISQANAKNSQLGELPLVFTEEWRNFVRGNVANSWDLAGQQTFQIQFEIQPGYLSPNIDGIIEADTKRNTITVNGQTQAYLEPVTYRVFTTNLIGGMNPITTVPFNFPIARIWFLGSTPGNLTQLEVLQDGNKILEGYQDQLLKRYAKYGFEFGQATFANQNQTSAKPLGLNPINYFDLAAIFDEDSRYEEALKCVNSLEVRVWSAIAQTVTILVEYLPGAFQS